MNNLFARLFCGCAVGLLMLSSVPSRCTAAETGPLQTAGSIALPFERARALSALLEDADSEELARYFTQAQGLPAASKQEFTQQILRYWAARNGKAALDACLAVKPEFEQRNYIKALFDSWGEADPKAAFAVVKANEGAPAAYHMFTGFFEGYARRNPPEAFAFILEKQKEQPFLFSDWRVSMNVILRRWAEQDPDAAMKAVLAAKDDNGRDFSAYTVMRTWFAEDSRACLRAIARAPQDERTQLLYGAIEGNVTFENWSVLMSFIHENFKQREEWITRNIFVSLAKEDLTQAFALAQKIQDSPEGKRAMEGVFEVWGKKDFDAAIRQAEALTDAKMRIGVLQAIWRERADAKKLPESFSLLCKIPDPAVRKQLMGDLTRQYLQQGGDIGLLMKQISTPQAQREFLTSLVKSPEGYWWGFSINDQKTARAFREWALLLPPSECRKQLLTNALRSSELDLSDLQWINERLPRGEANQVLSDILNNSEQSMRDLLTPDNFQQLPEGPLKDKFAEAMLREMSKKSPEEAQQWIASMPAGELRDNAYRNLLSTLVEGGQLEQALAALRTQPEGIQGNIYFYRQIGEKLAKKNPQDAIAWAMALEDKGARQMALSGVGSAWNTKDPEGFFAQMQQWGNIPESKNAIASFVTMWGYSNPEGAAVWIKANAAGNEAVIKQSVVSMFGNWVSNDPMAATQWLTTLPEGGVRNQAIASMVGSQEAVKSPEGVLEWVMSVSPEPGNENRREQLMQILVSRVNKKNPEAAQALLQNPKLTQSEREAMQKALSSGGAKAVTTDGIRTIFSY